MSIGRSIVVDRYRCLMVQFGPSAAA